MSDEELLPRIRDVLVTTDEPAAEGRAAIVPFITYAVALRIHNEVQKMVNGGTYASKHVALALVILDMTGVVPPNDRGEVEQIGQRFDRDQLDVHVARRRAITRCGHRSAETKAQKLREEDESLLSWPWGAWPAPGSRARARHVTPRVERGGAGPSGDAAWHDVRQRLVEATRQSTDVQRAVISRDAARAIAQEKAAVAAVDRQVAREALKARRAAERATEQAERAGGKAVAKAARVETKLEETTEVTKHLQSSVHRLTAGLGQAEAAAERARLKATKDAEKAAKAEAALQAQLEKKEAEMQHLRELKAVQAQLKRQAQAEAAAAAAEAAAAERRAERQGEKRAAAEDKWRAAATERDANRALLEGHGEAAMERQLMMSDADEAADQYMPAGRTASDGRYAAFSWRTRVLFHRWLSRRIAPSAAILAYMDAAKHFAPEKKVRQPLRAETSILGEMISAMQVAWAKRVLSFGFDETTKKGDGLASTNTQIETEEGEILDVVLRGAFFIPGGCADQVARAMEEKLFSRGRKLIQKAKEVYERKNPGCSWEGPDPAQLGYHRLARSVIMSDTCTPARAAKRQIMEQAATAVEEDVGAAAWALLSVEEKAVKTATYAPRPHPAHPAAFAPCATPLPRSPVPFLAGGGTG